MTTRTGFLWLAGLMVVALMVVAGQAGAAIGTEDFVTTMPSPGSFPLVADGEAARLWVDDDDWTGVIRAAGDLQQDIERVSGIEPTLWKSTRSRDARMVLIGTLGHSELIDRLSADGTIDVRSIEGRWESYVLQTVDDPLPGIDEALVIAGSDKRGTIYGIYELSGQIGVSPWYWWADSTPEHADALFVSGGRYEFGEPSVRYRGIFLNDERPDLDYWVRFTYGERPDPVSPDATVANFNSDFYARIFEVLLRMKGNYLWPAMWNNAFAEDDAGNAGLADEYGIVMGTSHQEPMMRAQKEWDWHYQPELGNWNFAEHPRELTQFWRGAVAERGAFENIYTIGLRGENDTAMIHGVEENIRLLQEIVDVQRGLLADELGVDPATVPQVWTLYKEVQGYYERGLRVPDDVTLLWAEDNWGNVRRLPTADERERAGGAGVYYHFDYHGGPRSYQWLNTNPIAKIWDQMALSKQYGADRVWIVNVGHFKGYELPMEYFLDLAWDTDRWTHDNIREYMELWAAREFGSGYAEEAAAILADYTRFNGRRKPELLRPDTYSLVNYREAERVVDEYNAVVERAQALHDRLPEHKRSVFYQLALFPAKASAQVNALYQAAGLNALYAQQGRAATASMAERTRELFESDQALMAYFNEELEGGKWNHFMDQTHIGYRSWADPPVDSLDAIVLTEPELPAEAGLGVAVEGDRAAWPAEGTVAGPSLPVIDVFNRQSRWIEIFNRGAAAFRFDVAVSEPWIVVSQTRGEIDRQTRIEVEVDFDRLPTGRTPGQIVIEGAGETVTVQVTAFRPADIAPETLDGFVASQGVVSIEAEHYTNRMDEGDSRWLRIEDFGHSLSGMRATAPVDTAGLEPGRNAPRLEYRIWLHEPGPVDVQAIVAPTLNFAPDRGLRMAVSFDEGPAQVLSLVPQGYDAANGNRDWEASVRDNARTVTSTHEIDSSGYHTLKVWMIDPAVVVQKLVVHPSGVPVPDSYLGPPESFLR